MTNPNPARITEPLWWLWITFKAAVTTARLGGIYADTRGYHNTRQRLKSWLPGNYSIQLDMDQRGPDDKAAGIDLTLSEAEMRKRTGYLRRSALDPRDNRLRALREFIGTLDGERVYCRIDGNAGLGQSRGSDDWTRDSTHLWHIHISVLRAYVNDQAAIEAVLSVLVGETWEQWTARQGDDVSWTDKIPAQQWAQDAGLYETSGYNEGEDVTAGWHLANTNGNVRKIVLRQVPELLAGQAAILAAVAGDDVKAAVDQALREHEERERGERQAELAGLAQTLGPALVEELRNANLPADAVEDAVAAVLSRVRLTTDAA